MILSKNCFIFFCCLHQTHRFLINFSMHMYISTRTYTIDTHTVMFTFMWKYFQLKVTCAIKSKKKKNSSHMTLFYSHLYNLILPVIYIYIYMYRVYTVYIHRINVISTFVTLARIFPIHKHKVSMILSCLLILQGCSQIDVNHSGKDENILFIK